MNTDQIITTLAIIERGTAVLLAKRRADVKWEPNKWGFPGGKIEYGELPEDALRREIEEELGVKASIGDLICVHAHVYEHPEQSLHTVIIAYKAKIDGEPLALGDQAIEWVEKSKVRSYDLIAGNLPIIDACLGI